MQFCDFISRLKRHYACSSQGSFALNLFAALCGDSNPIVSNKQDGYSHCLPAGLSGNDTTYRKALFNSQNKKYRGLSSPIKAYVIQKSNKDTFIAYSETAVSSEGFKGLCDDFGVPLNTARALLLEAIFEQLLEFSKSGIDSTSDTFVADFITERLMNPHDEPLITEVANNAFNPIYSGDDFSLVRQVPSYPCKATFYDKLTHCWVVQNSGIAVWNERYMEFVNADQTPLKVVVTRIEIKKTPLTGEVAISVDIEARHSEGVHEIILDMRDRDGRVCFPDKRAELHLLVAVGWKNKT